MRTLVISDLHIGQPGGTAVLERKRPLEILSETLSGFDRLVLIGDTIELTEGSRAHSALTCAPILRRLGQSVGEILLLPGNHDHRLIEPWARDQGRGLEREQQVPPDVTPMLAEMVGWLSASGAKVEVHYPGVWLSDNIWATHGHYLNHFLRPIASFGRHPKEHRRGPAGPMLPADFEHVVYGEQKPERIEGVPTPRLHDRLIPWRLAPAVSWALDLQARRHALPAFSQVTSALGLAGSPAAASGAGEARGIPEPRAEYALFGHIHRFGPLPLDNPREWTTPAGLQLMNVGSWRYEPVLVTGADGMNPYWPGGCVMITEDGVPRGVQLLSELTADELR